MYALLNITFLSFFLSFFLYLPALPLSKSFLLLHYTLTCLSIPLPPFSPPTNPQSVWLTSMVVRRSNFCWNWVMKMWTDTRLLMSPFSTSRMMSVSHSKLFCVRVTHRKYTCTTGTTTQSISSIFNNTNAQKRH